MSTVVKIPLDCLLWIGKEILSDERTTQGDPMAMPIYATGITTLFCASDNDSDNGKRRSVDPWCTG